MRDRRFHADDVERFSERVLRVEPQGSRRTQTAGVIRPFRAAEPVGVAVQEPAVEDVLENVTIVSRGWFRPVMLAALDHLRGEQTGYSVRPVRELPVRRVVAQAEGPHHELEGNVFVANDEFAQQGRPEELHPLPALPLGGIRRHRPAIRLEQFDHPEVVGGQLPQRSGAFRARCAAFPRLPSPIRPHPPPAAGPWESPGLPSRAAGRPVRYFRRTFAAL